jgi:uncharacterized membrane protein
VIERYEVMISEHHAYEERHKSSELLVLQLRQEIEEWKKKFITLEGSYKEFRTQHETYRAEMDNRFELVIQQNDKLNSMLNEKHEEMEHVKKSARVYKKIINKKDKIILFEEGVF